MSYQLSIAYYPTHQAVTGLVVDDATPFAWYETVKLSGFYCDDEECPDDGECPTHPASYWLAAREAAWLDSVTARGMRPVEDAD